MSRSGYSDDYDDQDSLNLYRANVDRTIGGKHGQTFLREMAAALDALAVKELVADAIVRDETHVCAIGAVALARKLDVSKIDPYDRDSVAGAFGVTPMLACEIAYENDECGRVWDGTVRSGGRACANGCPITSRTPETLRAREDEMAETKVRPPDEPCKCGKHMLQPWWAAITDAGNDGTDYMRHSRESCLTQTERARARLPPWRSSRHLEQTNEGPYIVDCSTEACDDPTHFGGTITDSARRLDGARASGRSV